MTDLTGQAVRLWRNGKAKITVTLSDGSTHTLGGKRAERAAAVLVQPNAWTGGRHHGESIRLFCRGDAAAARAEAQRITTQTIAHTRYGDVPCTPLDWAFTLEVREADREREINRLCFAWGMNPNSEADRYHVNMLLTEEAKRDGH